MGKWLMALASPIARQILISLGIGVVTFVGLDTALAAALAAAKQALGGLPGDTINILGLGGVFQACSILAGGLTARVSLALVKQFRVI